MLFYTFYPVQDNTSKATYIYLVPMAIPSGDINGVCQSYLELGPGTDVLVSRE